MLWNAVFDTWIFHSSNSTQFVENDKKFWKNNWLMKQTKFYSPPLHCVRHTLDVIEGHCLRWCWTSVYYYTYYSWRMSKRDTSSHNSFRWRNVQPLIVTLNATYTPFSPFCFPQTCWKLPFNYSRWGPLLFFIMSSFLRFIACCIPYCSSFVICSHVFIHFSMV